MSKEANETETSEFGSKISEFDKQKYWFYIDSELNDLNETERKFFEIELDYKFTNFKRISDVITFIKKWRRDEFKQTLKPQLLFIRGSAMYERDYKYSKKLLERGFEKIKNENEFWDRSMIEYGI